VGSEFSKVTKAHTSLKASGTAMIGHIKSV